MFEETWSKTMDDISESELESAMGFYHRKKKSRTMWRRATAAAVALVILVTALVFWPVNDEPEIIAVPGVMKVYACEFETTPATELEEYELTDTVDSYKKVLVPYTNFMGEPIPFTLRIPDDYYGEAEISFFVSVDYGKLFEDKNVSAGAKEEIKVGNREMIRWIHGSMSEATDVIGHRGRFYANIIIFADERVVGYGIIDFVFYNAEGMMPSFVTTGFSTVCFPMVDGEFQDVSEEYVLRQIDEYKRTKPEPEVSPMC